MTNIFRIPFAMMRPIYERTSFHRSVIEELDEEHLRNAYRHCREITRHFAKTFYMATRFLPNDKQRGIFAIYGMCRYLDNLVDEAEDLVAKDEITHAEISQRLDEWRKCLLEVYDGNTCNDPILTAFADSLHRYHIPIKLPLELMEGVKIDLIKNRYNNFEELYDYSYKVASVVGLMTSEVFGYCDDKALEYAVDLGIAMQLTNILRDVGEDLKRDRIYIPQDELKMFEVSEAELKKFDRSENFIQLMKFQIERATKYYKRAEKGIEMLDKDSRLPVYLARFNYARILDKIEENNYQVFEQRAYLNSTEKLAILPKIIYQMKIAS